jgi:hypothetical protein
MVTYARRVRGLWIALLVLSVGGFAAATAQAKVHVDPNSAPGKEYEVPLDRVRHDAAPAGGSDSGQPPSGGDQTPAAPAFGVGLSPKSADQDRSGDKTDSGSKPDGASGSSGSGPNGDSSPGRSTGTSATEAAVRAASSGGGGIGPTLAFTALGVGTLLLGGVVGLVLRRRTRQEAL